MELSEALHMQLVDDAVLPRRARPPVLAPGKRGIDDLAAAGADHPRIRIEQHLVWIEAVAVIGIVRPVNAVGVDQAWPRIRQVAVPDKVGALPELDALGLAPAARVEQTQLHALGVFREQREVDPAAVPGGAKRIRAATPDRAGNDQGCYRRFHSALI